MTVDPTSDPHAAQLADLLDVLNLDVLGESRIRVHGVPGDEESELGESVATVFVGRSQKQPHGRVFGGQVLAQGLVAAGMTVREEFPERQVHSLHAYFVRPGDDTHPIRFTVEELHDGNSFSTRRVQAIQRGRPILTMSASFQRPAGGMDHQDPMPHVAAPEGLASPAEIFGAIDHPAAQFFAFGRPVDIRHAEGEIHLTPGREQTSYQHVWMKTYGHLPNDPLIHAAVLAYASDYPSLEPILRRHGVVWTDPRLRAASLDHAMWFHRTPRVDEWNLYSQFSPSATSGRGLGMGKVFGSDGRLVATVAQEGMLRLKGAAEPGK